MDQIHLGGGGSPQGGEILLGVGSISVGGDRIHLEVGSTSGGQDSPGHWGQMQSCLPRQSHLNLQAALVHLFSALRPTPFGVSAASSPHSGRVVLLCPFWAPVCCVQ